MGSGCGGGLWVIAFNIYQYIYIHIDNITNAHKMLSQTCFGVAFCRRGHDFCSCMVTWS